MIINILGTNYIVDNTRRDLDGTANPGAKVLYAPENPGEDYDKQLKFRKAIIHAFLLESGLDDETVFDWTSRNTVDWFAHQMPKMITAMTIGGAI